MSCEPLTVAEGHEPVLSTLPDRHGILDGAEVEAPVRQERHVIVKPPPDPVTQALARALPQELGELACQDSPVNV